MDPLQPLFELFDEMQVREKPPLQDSPMPMETPISEPEEHPVTKQKKEVDKLIQQGMPAPVAHQQVHGEVDTGDVDSKAEFASTLSRKQSEKDKRGVRVDKNGEALMAKEKEFKDSEDNVTPEDLKTPMAQQVPDSDQTQLDQMEDIDYEDDVNYLKTDGRAGGLLKG